MTRCGGCDRNWTGLAEAHCATCHRHFTGVTAFDAHRVGPTDEAAGPEVYSVARQEWVEIR